VAQQASPGRSTRQGSPDGLPAAFEGSMHSNELFVPRLMGGAARSAAEEEQPRSGQVSQGLSSPEWGTPVKAGVAEGEGVGNGVVCFGRYNDVYSESDGDEGELPEFAA